MKTDLAYKRLTWLDPYTKDKFGQPMKIESVPLNYKKIKAHLLEYGKFDHDLLKLPEFVSFWMDRSIDLAMNFYHKTETEEIIVRDELITQQYGESFPVRGKLNQEGLLITSFNVILTERIITLRKYLVTASHLFHTSNWIFSLKELLNNVVSLLDITLNQFYLKAKYHKKENWNFNSEILGQIHNRRLNDKLKWVRIITGKELNIEKQRPALENIRQIRNHLNHFDPPVFAVTLQEVCTWLNQIMDIISITMTVRHCTGEQFNSALIELYLQPDVVYTPYVPRNEKVQHEGFGYCSVKYPINPTTI